MPEWDCARVSEWPRLGLTWSNARLFRSLRRCLRARAAWPRGVHSAARPRAHFLRPHGQDACSRWSPSTLLGQQVSGRRCRPAVRVDLRCRLGICARRQRRGLQTPKNHRRPQKADVKNARMFYPRTKTREPAGTKVNTAPRGGGTAPPVGLYKHNSHVAGARRGGHPSLGHP